MVALSTSYLASAYVQLVRLDDARRCISEAFTATETTGERWCEAEITVEVRHLHIHLGAQGVVGIVSEGGDQK